MVWDILESKSSPQTFETVVAALPPYSINKINPFSKDHFNHQYVQTLLGKTVLNTFRAILYLLCLIYYILCQLITS